MSFEAIFLENAALKTTLEHHRVGPQTYQRECAELLDGLPVSDPSRAIFSTLRAEIGRTTDLSAALESLLRAFPKTQRPS